MFRRLSPIIFFLVITVRAIFAADPLIDLRALTSPVLLRGDTTTAYRDPMLIFHAGTFRLFFTLVKIEPDGRPFSYVAWSSSTNLTQWSAPVLLTPRDQALNYGSPGNIVRHENEWVMCLQTYPRPHGEKYGNADARLFTMRSEDLEHWSAPELLRVLGPDVSRDKMGRMIDPFLLRDKDVPGQWRCFYKRGSDGIFSSTSPNLKTWKFEGRAAGGENPCVIVDGNEYLLSYSPRNGIGLRRSADGKTWRDQALLTLGQAEWPWAQGRLTAGFLLDLRAEPRVGKVLLVFHGSDYPETDPRGGFDNYASIGLAWSDDLKHWAWPSHR